MVTVMAMTALQNRTHLIPCCVSMQLPCTCMQPPRSRSTYTARGMPASAEGRSPRLTLSAWQGRWRADTWLSPSCLRTTGEGGGGGGGG
jgi:hypothetical protein